jgi:hypothetical protein
MANKVQIKQLRSFGLMLACVFAVVGFWPVWRNDAPRIWAFPVAAVFALTASVFPVLLGTAYRGWMKLGETLGWISSHVILTAVFYAVVAPIGGLLRLFGRDPLQRKFQPGTKSYLTPRQPSSPTHLEHQF